MKYLFLLGILGLCSACTSPQHVRRSAYYQYDWGVSGAMTGQTQQAQQHHPIFAGTKMSAEGPATYEKHANYFIFGLLPLRQEVKMSEACGKMPFRQAYVDHSFWQATVSLLTLGVYTPRTIQVWCGHETAQK